MPLYNCEICNYSTKLKYDFNKHLKTKKHHTNYNKLSSCSEKSHNFPSKTLQNPPKNDKNPPKPSGIPPKVTPKPSKTLQNPAENSENSDNLDNETTNSKCIYICEHCNKEFSRKDNLKRHIEMRCKAHKKEEVIDYKEMFYLMKSELEKEKNEFKKQINILLEKVGNTTNNITNTQNIQLNSYGNEDLSHITETLKTELIKIPFGMIPKMIEEVHFNENKPENKNIALTNKKDNKIKVFSNDKWVYRNKDETINDLVDCKYYILDSHYQQMENSKTFTNENKMTYEKFKTYYDDGDKKMVEQMKKDCDLILLNNR